MLWFDYKFPSIVAMIGISILMYLRLVDDVNLVSRAIPRNTIYDEVSKKLKKVETLSELPEDKHTMNVLRCIADDVIPMLKWEYDCPSLHPRQELPVLGLRIMLNDDKDDKSNKLIHRFYQEPMAFKGVISKRAAMSPAQKFAVLT